MERDRAKEEPPIDSICASQTSNGLTGRARSEDSPPCLHKAGKILRTKRLLPTPTNSLVQGESGILAPALVQKVYITVGTRRPDQSGNRVDGETEFVAGAVCLARFGLKEDKIVGHGRQGANAVFASGYRLATESCVAHLTLLKGLPGRHTSIDQCPGAHLCFEVL